jgi:hypothetical protein
MKDFKFFQKGTLDNPQLLGDELTRSTASFNADTPEGYMNRRMSYHTNRGQYDRLRQSNNEMEQYFIERGFHQEDLTEQRDLNETEQYLTFFSPITVTKVNPKWWMKIKMFFQEVNFDNILGIILIAGSLTFGVILGIAKILNAF